jgi:drug/metabolite transporter (DMT)-like permease
LPVFLAGLSASLLGFADFFAGAGSRRTDHPGAALSIAWMASIVGAIAAGLYLLVFPPQAFGRDDLLWSLGAGVFAAGARPLLYRCMERGPIVVAAPTIGVVALVVPSVIGPLTGSPLRGLELIGVLMAIPAVVLIVAEGRLPTVSGLAGSPALAPSALTGALIGAMALCLAEVSPEAEAMPALVTQSQSILLIPLVAGFVGGLAPSNSDLRRFALLIGLIDIVAIIASTIAFQHGNVAVISAIMGFAPAVTISLAWGIDGEKVYGWQWLGAAMATMSIVLFAFAA